VAFGHDDHSHMSRLLQRQDAVHISSSV